MRLMHLAALAAAAVLAIGAGKPAPRNWNTVVQVLPSGSHLLGNPAAARLTEYISYTCPHCAHFDSDASDPLRLYFIMSGKLAVEVRHLVRDPIDMTVAMLTNCGARSKFFGNHTAFLRSQDRWIVAADNASDAQQARWTNGEQTARRRAIANDFGFYAIMGARGYDRPSIDRCLADNAMAQRLAAQTSEAAGLGVQGTPSFLLDGELLAGTHDWQTLQVQLKARTARAAQ